MRNSSTPIRIAYLNTLITLKGLKIIDGDIHVFTLHIVICNVYIICIVNQALFIFDTRFISLIKQI